MQRNLVLALLVLAGAALAVVVGLRGMTVFSSPQGQSGESAADPPADSTSRTATAVPQFGEWPEPAAVLVLTGEAHGYLEPCGCSDKQSGGLARRSDLFKQLRSKNWSVAGLDLGGTLERARKQSEFKFSAMTAALRQLDYRGLGLGVEELRLQPAFLITENVPAEEGTPGMAFLGANEIFFGDPTMVGGPARSTVFELGGTKVGAAMVLGESRQRGLYPEGAVADVTFVPPAEALTTAVEQFQQAGTGFEVLLSYADLDESRKLAQQFPQFDVVVSAGGPEDPDGKPEMIGKTLLVSVGHKGKYAGILAFYPQDAQQPFRYELVDLNRDHFKHDPAMDDVMRQYQQLLVDNLADVFADLPEGFPARDGEFVGAAKCGQCHKKALAKWKSTKHAQAYVSLTKGRENFDGAWVDRTHDPECLSCHVTGWNPQEDLPLLTGFLPKEIAAERGEPHRFDTLQGQQCENCHGPGSGHSATMAQWLKDADSVAQADFVAAKTAVKIDRATAKQSLCVKCHDYENSPDFDFEKYWKEVDHTGLRD